MERAIESENKTIVFEIVTDFEEEVAIVKSKQKAKRIYRVPGNTLQYVQSLSGFVVIVSLLFVPLITLPGMILLVLLPRSISLIGDISKLVYCVTPGYSSRNKRMKKVPRMRLTERWQGPVQKTSL
jgi:hypothetical protein